MKAIIKLDVPEWQIGEEVSVFFPDSMCKHSVCEKNEAQWLENTEPCGHYEEIAVACCSVCGESYVLGELGIDDMIREFKFCPNCGRQMGDNND